ncbi:helix-turn-helix domain-containing protein [Enterococcus quebecensis]|uniref:PRD domain-containing protein n=1 Tax=Enterococcus quebecensis TaxID=903983 RepID=A0A1E5H2X2_9ENTE|nr:helix-turn-helix domain-containing protein [Enterococcus quebecensis]OEG19261.1 hypothetical protein BCR23_00805 [Enterococcus quebecensis]OJG75826.1 hypothetical protein RV12_GL000165 [Enterococcus quebecensis]
MEYKEIFDFESGRLFELFKLLKSVDTSISLEQLSIEIDVSQKTILRYIKKVKKLFEIYQLENHLAIVSRSKNSFYLKRDNDLYSEIFLVQYLSNLPEVIFLKAIIEEETILTKNLAEKLLISESCLRRRVKRINDRLKKFGVYLRRGTYELSGEEEQIRELILHFYWFVYQGTNNNFLLQEKAGSRQLTQLLIDFFNMQINDIQKEALFRIIQIAIWRYQKGKAIKIKAEWQQYINESSIFAKLQEAMRINETYQYIDIEEVAYLYLIIQARFLPYFGSSMQAYIIEEHYIKKTTCYSRTIVMTNKFRHVFWEKKFKHSKDSIVASLGFHLYYELISYFYFERNQPAKVLQEAFPNFTSKLDECVSGLSKNSSIYQRIPKDALFYRYFMILSSLISPVYSEKRIFICLMTDLSLEKEIELGKRITSFFYERYNLTVIYARKTKSIMYADVILTTVFYQDLIQKHSQPVLLIGQNFSEKIFFQIENLLKKI